LFITIKEAEMEKLLKCEVCSKRASYAFKRNDFIRTYQKKVNATDVYVNICVECNKVISEKVPTFPLFQIIKGGKFKGRLKYFEKEESDRG
jgi:catabolite regulation protein CreA